MSGDLDVRVWTMRVGDENEPAAARWSTVLDPGELERAGRFAFARHRTQFIAAHALTRAALSALTGVTAASWRFVPDALGKPAAWHGGAPAPVAFSLAHTEGMVGVAATPEPGCLLGFDLEPVGRAVPPGIAEHFFAPPEVRWLQAQPASSRPLAFFRLWTLKEAFIKATGKGLTQDLGAFWFDLCPLRLHLDRSLRDQTAGWTFEQRADLDGFVAAVGVRCFDGRLVRIFWEKVDPAGFDPAAGL